MADSKKSVFIFALIIWFLGAFFFFSEYFLRVSPEVMYPELMLKYTAGAAAMGALSSFYYYPYIFMQIPVGIVTDKFGPRKVMTFAAFLTGLGCILFTFAHHVEFAVFSRAIMGFCGAFAFVGTLRIAINWFDKKYFALLVGLTQASGMLGAAFGSAPLSIYVHHVGVNFAMLSFAGLFIALAVAMAIVVKNTPKNKKAIISGDLKIWSGIKEVSRSKQLWVNCLFIGFLYGPTTVLAESWGVSFTSALRGFDATDSAFLVGLIFIGLVVGCPIMGALSSRFGNVPLMRVSAFMCLLLSALIIYCPGLSIFTLMFMYFIYGIFNSGIIPSYARAATLVRREVSGIALGVTNMASVLLGAITIQVIGVLLQSYGHQVNTGIEAIYSGGSYQSIFVILSVSFAICFALTFLMSEKKEVL